MTLTDDEARQLVAQLKKLESKVKALESTTPSSGSTALVPKAEKSKALKVQTPVFGEKVCLESFRTLVDIWEQSSYIQEVESKERARLLLSVIESDLQVRLWKTLTAELLTADGFTDSANRRSNSVDYFVGELNNRYGRPEIEVAEEVFTDFEHIRPRNGESHREFLVRWREISKKLVKIDAADIISLRLCKLIGLTPEARVTLQAKVSAHQAGLTPEQQKDTVAKQDYFEKKVLEILGSQKIDTSRVNEVCPPAGPSQEQKDTVFWSNYLPSMEVWEDQGKHFCLLGNGRQRECEKVPDSANTYQIAHKFNRSKGKGKGKSKSYQQNQFQPGKGGSKGKGWKKNLTCHACGGSGHFARECPDRNGKPKETANIAMSWGESWTPEGEW